ncbi:MAG TPA: hypothetical protein VLZ75_04590 [Chitinophagales bacterium]|nr:hypothetical protein [Chitinophagales bacterium]
MKGSFQKTTLTYFLIWCLLFALGNINWMDNNYPIQFFTLRLGIVSLAVLIVQWWWGTGERANSSQSILITMSAYGLKMFICTVIFIYYFHFNRENKEISVMSGFLIFFLFSLLEVTYGLKLTKKKD